MGYSNTITLDLDYEEAVTKVKETFKSKGFGTLTEIDVRATLREKIGEEMEPYLIIGPATLIWRTGPWTWNARSAPFCHATSSYAKAPAASSWTPWTRR